MEDKKKTLKKALLKYSKPIKMVKEEVKNRFGNIKATLDKSKSERRSVAYDKILTKIKRAKSYDDAPDYVDGRPTDAYIARFEAKEAKDKYKKKLK